MKRKSITVLFIFLLNSLLYPAPAHSQTNNNDLTGLWKSNTNDSILIYRIGLIKPEYLVNLVKQSMLIRCIASPNGDTLFYQPENNPSNNETYFLINPAKNGLFDKLGISKKKQSFTLTDPHATDNWKSLKTN